MEEPILQKIGRGALSLAFIACVALPSMKAFLPEGTIPSVPDHPYVSAAGGGGTTLAENFGPDLLEEAYNSQEGLPEPSVFSEVPDLFYSSYKVTKGDTISHIADSFGLTQDTILSFNSIKNSRLLQINQYLKIPNQDGVLYSVKKGDSLDSIASRYEIDAVAIVTTNELLSTDLTQGEALFLPAARLARMDLQEINGDLFIWPIRGYISSRYGWRTSPFTGARQFHSGLDIAASQGTPIRAAMAGRVSSTGYDVNSGNYIVLSHHSGYRTFYGHLEVIRVSAGEYVKTNQRIGDAGSTGLSTGSHLHFTVFKNGLTVNPLNLMN